MGYPPAVRERAKAAYLSGEYKNAAEVAKAFGIKGEETIYNWSRKYRWGNFREKVSEKIVEKTVNKMADWIIKQAKIGQFMQAKGIKKLQITPEEIIPIDEARQLVTAGADIERKAMTYGREEKEGQTVNVNIYLPEIKEEMRNVTPEEVSFR